MTDKESTEYLGISLIQVVKEMAGRIRLLEETIRRDENLFKHYTEQLQYRAAYEEDEYGHLAEEMRLIMTRLPDLEGELDREPDENLADE
ncbi:MAG: hypothetical protein JW797_00665 [Bradymonadales bacterium]|nr:hypothetical protein [Bradymonadales bacterium]